MAGYQVAEGTQVHLDGVTYPSGAKVPAVDSETAAGWVAAGWVVPVARRPRAKPPTGSFRATEVTTKAPAD
jgi:hypothetical protein